MNDHPMDTTTGLDEERGHTFDGITEFDNRLPNWWLWTFYLACIFSVAYWFAFHTTGFAALPTEVFREQMASIDAARKSATLVQDISDESLRALADQPEVVARGKAIFEANCVACHTASGGGLVGPNLTDKFWIHGGAPTAIYKTIVEGVVQKGMIPWEPSLGTAGCQEVLSYVLTLRNTNVAGGKAAEGEPYDAN